MIFCLRQILMLVLTTQKNLNDQRKEPNKLLNDEARGAFIKTRFQHVNEVDTCSSYFFNLEKFRSLSKSISSIRLSSGEIMDDPAAIRKHVRDVYQNLYSQPQTDEGALDEIVNNLTKLHPADSEDLDIPLSLEELDTAVKQLGKNKTPGLGGLTSEFFFFSILLASPQR